MNARQHRVQITRDAVRRFMDLPSKSIARYLVDSECGYLYDRNIEIARKCVVRVRGKNGKHNRENIADKSLYADPKKRYTIPPTWRKKRILHKLPEGLWLVLSDLHVPFHEPKPIETSIKYGQANKVDGIFINGDLMDCSAISYWPTIQRNFDKDVESSIDFLDFLRQEFPKAKIVYKPGNHEYRLPRLFLKKLPELASSPLAAMETIMGFEARGIEFLDYYQIVKAGLLPILHGHEMRRLSRLVNPARGLFLRTKTYSACSHCHITSMHTTTNLGGEVLTTWSFGCLCDLHPDWWVYGNDWNWGCALINVEKNGDFDVENRRILSSGELR